VNVLPNAEGFMECQPNLDGSLNITIMQADLKEMYSLELSTTMEEYRPEIPKNSVFLCE
jgi:hypothetical protein